MPSSQAVCVTAMELGARNREQKETGDDCAVEYFGDLTLLLVFLFHLDQLVPIAAQHYHHRPQNDLQVKQQRPVFYIKQIQFDHLLKRQTVSA